MEEKPIHNQYALKSGDADVDKKNNQFFFKRPSLKQRQEQSLFLGNYQTSVMKMVQIHCVYYLDYMLKISTA